MIPAATHRHPLSCLALAAFAWLYTAAAAAQPATTGAGQAYPAKPVRYIVPFPAAASPDIIARLLAERLSRMWNQQVVVDNRCGAGGTLGAAFAAKSAPDGYTLFQCNVASSAVAPSLYANMPYEHQREQVVESAPSGREEFARFIAAETARWTKVVKAAGIAQQ